MSDRDRPSPHQQDSFAGALGAITGRLLWILIPLAIIALVLLLLR